MTDINCNHHSVNNGEACKKCLKLNELKKCAHCQIIKPYSDYHMRPLKDIQQQQQQQEQHQPFSYCRLCINNIQNKKYNDTVEKKKLEGTYKPRGSNRLPDELKKKYIKKSEQPGYIETRGRPKKNKNYINHI